MNIDSTLAMEIDAILNKTDDAIEKQDWSIANLFLKKGLDRLGDHYVTADVIDETGMKLILADVQDKKAAVQAAVGIRRSVLVARLEMLRQKISIKKNESW